MDGSSGSKPQPKFVSEGPAVVFRVMNRISEKHSAIWYAVWVGSEGENIQSPVRLGHKQPTPALSPFVAVVDNRVYVFGGAVFTQEFHDWHGGLRESGLPMVELTSETWCFDLDEPELGWFSRARMNVGRFNCEKAVCATLSDGMIYVTGGCKDGGGGTWWCERYDPSSDQWSALGPIPSIDTLPPFTDTEFPVDSILLVPMPSGPGLVCYDTRYGEWKLINPGYYFENTGPFCLRGDGILYMFEHSERVFAHTLFRHGESKRDKPAIVRGLRRFLPEVHEDYPSPHGCFFCLKDNRFGILWPFYEVGGAKFVDFSIASVDEASDGMESELIFKAKMERFISLRIFEDFEYFDTATVVRMESRRWRDLGLAALFGRSSLDEE